VSFTLDTRDLLERRVTLDAGAVYVIAEGAPPHDERALPVLTVAWLDEPAGVTLDEVVAEDVARQLSGPGAALLDSEATHAGGIDAVRTFVLHRGPSGLPAASEQWRLLADGRRWTVSALTALADQPRWGPRLAAVTGTLRLG
jgi:hypothetical protein